MDNNISNIIVTQDKIDKHTASFHNGNSTVKLVYGGFKEEHELKSDENVFEIERIQTICNFLSKHYKHTHTKKKTYKSYGFKHILEHLKVFQPNPYIASGELILACLILSIKIERDSDSWHALLFLEAIEKEYDNQPY